MSINEVKRKLNEYDAILKNKNQAEFNKTIHRTIRSVDLKNELNLFLIEYLFNNTGLNNFDNRQRTKTSLAYLANEHKKNNGQKSNFINYQTLVDNFLKVCKLSKRYNYE